MRKDNTSYCLRFAMLKSQTCREVKNTQYIFYIRSCCRCRNVVYV